MAGYPQPVANGVATEFNDKKNVCVWAIHGPECSVVFEALPVRRRPSQERPGPVLRPDFGGNGTHAGQRCLHPKAFEGGKL